MEYKPDNEDQVKRPTPEYQKTVPPIFHLFKFLLDRPIFLGAILGAIGGLLMAGYFNIQTNMAVIGGALAGLVIAIFIVRLRSIGKA
jgi:hypothetical protein